MTYDTLVSYDTRQNRPYEHRTEIEPSATRKANEAGRLPITWHVRDYTDRMGRPGRINDGYEFNGKWYKTMRETKAARVALEESLK